MGSSMEKVRTHTPIRTPTQAGGYLGENRAKEHTPILKAA